MGCYIVKLADDRYCEWSTIVDAPVTYIADRHAAVQSWGEERIARADCNGTSILDDYPAGETPEEIVRGNRAGPNETELIVAEILAAYDNADPAPWT